MYAWAVWFLERITFKAPIALRTPRPIDSLDSIKLDNESTSLKNLFHNVFDDDQSAVVISLKCLPVHLHLFTFLMQIDSSHSGLRLTQTLGGLIETAARSGQWPGPTRAEDL